MPKDYRTEIARIERILATGARSIDVDGMKTQVDVDSLRTELRKLKEADYDYRGRRPVVATMNLRNV